MRRRREFRKAADAHQGDLWGTSPRHLTPEGPLYHANLSGMLPQMPQALNPGFDPGHDSAEVSSPERIDHMCQICPTCSQALQGHRCKLVCTNCGYYMSCADYY
ncbi:MAG: hypothetical protein ACLGSD_16050 [Acidobacteriota bacterium]